MTPLKSGEGGKRSDAKHMANCDDKTLYFCRTYCMYRHASGKPCKKNPIRPEPDIKLFVREGSGLSKAFKVIKEKS